MTTELRTDREGHVVNMQPARRPSVAGDTFRPDSAVSDDSHRKSDKGSETTKKKKKMKKKSKYTKHQWAIFFSFCFINVGAAMCYSLQAPFYPKEAEKKGASSAVYGFVFGVFELVDFIACPIYGKNIRAIGPKFMLIGGVSVMSVCCILFGFLDRVTAGVPFIALSFAVRIVEALGQAGFVTASYAIIAQEFPDNVASTFSALETAFGVGMIIGPTVGGILYEAGGFLLPFAATGSVLLTVSFGTFFIIPKLKESPQKSGSLVKLVLIPGVAICYFSVAVVAFSYGFTTTLLEPHLRPFILSPSIMGTIFVIPGATYALTAIIWGYIADRYVHPKLVCGLGASFITVAFLLIGPAPFIPLAPALWLVILALVLHGIGTGGQYVAAFLDSSREAFLNGYPDNIETYGMISGLWASGLALGSFIGPSVSGVLNDAIGFRNSSLVVVGLEVSVILLSFGFYYWRKLKGPPNTNPSTEVTPLITELESAHIDN